MLAIRFKNNRLYYLDQTRLPLKEVWRECVSVSQGYKAIKELQVRGAPLIGVFAAYCAWVGIKDIKSKGKRFYRDALKLLDHLQSCRPTAVNLAWALLRMRDVLKETKDLGLGRIKAAMLDEACRIHKEDQRLCRAIGRFGSTLIKPGDTILTHCNAGALATSGVGTALAVVYAAARKYKGIKVYADETRPLLQGSRLSAWELKKHKVDVTLNCDNMAADLMQRRKIDKVIVGADRVTASGDVANKIGTYALAVAAKYHRVPFYVAAPFSTFDLNLKHGKAIPIEQRGPDEVRRVLGKVSIAPINIKVYNPAFDVTPHGLITAIITDKGVIRPPFARNIKKIIGGKA